MSSFLKSLNTGLHEIFESEPSAVLLGEDILDPYGGAFKVSAGLSTKYPDRVFTTPISEASIIGVSNGLALRGMKPIAEIMFGDFLTLCADQLINHATKFNKMYNNKVTVPLVVRTPVGGGRGYGPTHSQSLEKIFLGIPHLKVVAPSVFHDPGTLLKHIIKNETSPVLFLEHKLLYPMELEENVSEEQEIAGYPTSIVRNFDAATKVADLTIVAYGGISRFIKALLDEMADEEIRITVVLPSILNQLPVNTLVRECRNSGNVLIIEEGTEGFNWGSEVAAVLYNSLWGKLKSPIQRLSSQKDIIPTSYELEEKMLVSLDSIRTKIFEII